MRLIKKTFIHNILFFLFISLIIPNVYSQEQRTNQIVYRDTVILFAPSLPIIFDPNHIFPTRLQIPENPLTKPLFPPFRVSKYKLFADVYNKYSIDRNAYNYLIKHNPKQIKYTTAELTGKEEPLEKIRPNIFQVLFTVDDDIDNNVAKPERFKSKRKYWIYHGAHSVKITQNQTSKNWVQGEIKYFNLLNVQKITFDYSKNKFSNNNSVEWRLSFFTNPNDSLRFYRIGEDRIRLNSNFGIHAVNNWYYSSNIEITTQLLKNYEENTDNPLSAAFSPLYINIGFLGMRYQIEKVFPKVRGKKINFNADISPLSINYVTVLNEEIDPKRFGIEEGKRHYSKFGSSVKANLVVNFNKNVNFTSRFYYFTNYETITAESENTLNMPINRYFATSIYLFVRFDDNKQLVRDPKLGHFQINELISFGFNYTW